MFVRFLLAIISINYSQGFVLECEFGNEEWINLGIVFQCKVHGMEVTSRNSITEVVGAPFRPIRDVRALDVQDQSEGSIYFYITNCMIAWFFQDANLFLQMCKHFFRI